MADITIVNGVYKPTYNWGAPACTWSIWDTLVQFLNLSRHLPIPQDFIPQVPLESEAKKAHPSPPATVKVKAGAWGLDIVLC